MRQTSIVVSASMMRNERASDTEFVETLMFTDRMIYSLFRYKKPEAEEGVIGSRNPFSSGYTMLNTAPNDSLDLQPEGGFSNKKFTRTSRKNSRDPVKLTKMSFISDDA